MANNIIELPLKGVRNQVIIATVSARHRELVGQYNWYYNRNRNDVYGRLKGGGRAACNFKLHRLLTNCPDDLEVDHINHDRLNNTDENLQVVDRTQIIFVRS